MQQFEARYVDAYNKRDANAVGALFTENGTEMSAFGGIAQGRQNIEKTLTAGFALPVPWKTEDTPKVTIALTKDVIVTQGVSRRTPETGSEKPVSLFYTKVLVREGGEWRLAAVQYGAAPFSRYVGPPKPAKPTTSTPATSPKS